MLFSLSTAMTTGLRPGSTGVQVGAPVFASAPTLSPGSGDTTTQFTLTLGAAGPGSSVLTPLLTLDGMDVSSQIVNTSGVLTYTPAKAGYLVWRVRAVNDVGTTLSVATAAPVISAPVFGTAPSIAPLSGEIGTEFTLGLGTASPGTPTLTGVLTLGGVDVTADIQLNGQTMTYTPTAAGDLVWQVTARNGAGQTLSGLTTVQVANGSTTGPRTITVGSASFAIDNAGQSGVDATGRAWVVVTGAANVTQITPAQTTVGGRVVGGVQKNPQRLSSSISDQGYDQRVELEDSGRNYSAALNLTGAISVVPGDRIVKAVPFTGAREYGAPFASEWATLHIVSAPVPANGVLAPTVGWAGASLPEYTLVDMTAVSARFKNHDATGRSFPPFSVLMQSLGKHAPVFAQNSATYRGTGYEPFMPPGLKGANAGGDPVQYGRDLAEIFEVAALALHYDAYTLAEKQQIAWALVRHGVEWVFPVIGSGFRIAADGGHQQFWQFSGILALLATGREAEITTFMQLTGGGNWDGYFRITDALLASEFSPHTSPTKPPMWRLRTLGTQPGGAALRLTMLSGDLPQVHIPAGSRVMRGGKVVATASGSAEFNDTGTIDLPLEFPPTPAFAAGDVIYLEGPGDTMRPGVVDWAQRPAFGPSGLSGGGNYFSPAAVNQYRSLQRNLGSIMSLRALGLRVPDFEAVEQYNEQNIRKVYPTLNNDYSSAHGQAFGLDQLAYDPVNDARSTDWRLFMEYPQDHEIVPSAPIVLNNVVAPGTVAPGPLVDGVVIGLVPGLSWRAVRMSGTGGTGGKVQARLLRQGDDTVLMGWFNVATVEDGTFDGFVVLPKCDDWVKVELRYSGGMQTYLNTVKWAVGYKFMILGQSQISIMGKAGGSGYQADPAYQGTASYYRWQQDNGGNTPEAETMEVMDSANAASDGVRAFVDQFRAFDPTTPVQVMRESIGGTGILQFTDDDTPGRMWSDLTNKTDRYGGDVTAVLENWNTSNASPLEGNEDIDILQGINTWVSEHGSTPDHALPDVLQQGYGYGTMPATRHSKSYTDQNHSAQKIVRALELGYAVGVPVGDYEIEDVGGPHPLNSGQGNVVLGARLGILAARTIGLTTPFNPYLRDTALRSEDGRHLDVGIGLPNGGALYSPNPAALSGFSVNEGSGFTESGFTAAIHGESTVRLTKTTGTWANVGSLQIKRDPNLNLNDPFVRATEQAIIGGELYESWSGDILGRGLPVHGRLVGDNQWTINNLAITQITQDGLGNGGASQAKLVSGAKQLDTTVSTNNRVRLSVDAWLDASTPPAAGDMFLIGGMHISNFSGSGTDMTGYAAKNTAGATVGSTSIIDARIVSSGGLFHSLRLVGYQASGTEVNLQTFTGSRSAMTYLPVYKLTGATLTGAITGKGTNSVTLTNVPAGSTLIAFAQNRDGTPLTWTGVTEDGSHAGVFGGNISYQSAASGGGGGMIVVQASGAEELIVVALPPA